MKAIILARVSSKEQEDNNSIPAQVRKLKLYTEKENLEVISIYQLVESSTKTNRFKFDEVIEKIDQSKEPIALVVDTIDRLQRSFRESVRLDELVKACKLELHFVRENLMIHSSSNSADILRWDMGVMFAKSYVTQLSDNVKRSQEEKIKNGEWLSKAPFGYKNVRKDGRAWIEPDENAHIVTEMFNRYATRAYSMQGTCTWLNEEYGLKKSVSSVDKILKNPFYAGKMRIKDHVYAHRYTPIISESLYDSVQSATSRHKKQPFKYAGLDYLYRGVMLCGHCGCRITPEKSKSHTYYHCTQYKGKHGARYLREEDITNQLKYAISVIQPNDEQFRAVIEALKKAHADQDKVKTNAFSRVNTELTKVTSKISKLFDLYLEGDITNEEYKTKRIELNVQKEKLERKLASLDGAVDEWYSNAITIMNLVKDAPLLFEESSEAVDKRRLLDMLFQNLEIFDDQLRWKYKKPFNLMVSYTNTSSWLGMRDSNPRSWDQNPLPYRLANPQCTSDIIAYFCLLSHGCGAGERLYQLPLAPPPPNLPPPEKPPEPELRPELELRPEPEDRW